MRKSNSLNSSTTVLFFTVLLTLLFIVPIARSAAKSCTTTCVSDEGCFVIFTQYSSEWDLHMECDGTFYDLGNGSGDYQGTICNGVEPCNVPMSN